MKTLTNKQSSNVKDMVAMFSSHDDYYSFGISKKMPEHISLSEWKYLLTKFPETDCLFFPLPTKNMFEINPTVSENMDTNYISNEPAAWCSYEMREINHNLRNDRKLIFHAFLWDWDFIAKHAKMIAKQGFTAVQGTPIQGVKGDGSNWWEYYQPLGLQFYEAPLGSLNSYKKMIKELHKYGLEYYQDVIFRHCAGVDNGSLYPHEKVCNWLHPYILTDKRNVEQWEYSEGNRWVYTNEATGMPMMNLWNPEYQKHVKTFISTLVGMGVDGLRIDQLKHYPTHDEGCDFLRNVIQPFEDSLYLYGEVIDPQDKWECDIYIKY